MNELLDKIAESGVKISEEKGDIEILPQYMRNCGFFHVSSDGWELLFVKGVYKDNIRYLSGKPPYEVKRLNDIAQTCADIERSLRMTVRLMMHLDDEDHYVTEAEAYHCDKTPDDMRNPGIHSPITSVERSLGKGSFINDRHLFSKTPFAEVMPETLSPAAMSLATEMPDIFNPLFMSCSIKTQSPSIKLLFGRLYFNMTDAETIIPAFYTQQDFFLLNYAQSLFNKIKKTSFGIPNDAGVKITDTEITEAVDDIIKTTESITRDDIFEKDFQELIALCVMAWEMIYIRLWKSFTGIHKMLGKDFDDVLRHVYTSRSDTILNEELENFHAVFDPACEPTDIKPCGLTHKTVEEMHKTLPASKRVTLGKGKYREKITEAHRYLKMRDGLYKAVSCLTAKMRSVMLETGESLVSDNIIADAADIFYFEMKEIKDILHDEYFGSIPFTINFRKWQNARFRALCLPNMLYEKDTEKAEELSKSQMEKSDNDKKIPCISVFHKEISTENFAVKRSFTMSDISSLSGKEAVAAESASLFSYAAEYCAVTGTPLYTGARFAGLLIKGGSIKTDKNSISYE